MNFSFVPLNQFFCICRGKDPLCDLKTMIKIVVSKGLMEFFLNVFTEISELRDKKYLSLKGLKPATS